MYRPGGDLPQFRPGGIIPVGPPPPQMMNMIPPPSFAPPPLPARPFMVPQFSAAYPPPPPRPANPNPNPPPHPLPHPLPPPPPPLPSGQPLPFVPPLPHSPPSEVPPPPPAGPPPSPPPLPSEESSAIDSLRREPAKPRDPEMLKNIEVLASFVVKNGPQFESMARAKQAGDPKFAFLFESDVSPEAVIGHEFYKWKKLQLRLEDENKRSKHSDSGKFSGRIQQANRLSGQTEELPGSPAMSDMDMEDDFAMPSPKKEPVGRPHDAKVGVSVETEQVSSRRAATSAEQDLEFHKKEGALGAEKPFDMPQVHNYPGFSEGSMTKPSRGEHSQTVQLAPPVVEDKEPCEKAPFFNRTEPPLCRLTVAHTGPIIDNYFSDTSDASGDWELPDNVDETTSRPSGNSSSWMEQDNGNSRTEHHLQREQTVPSLDHEDNMPPVKEITQDADKLKSRSPDLLVKQALPVPQERLGMKASRWGSPQSLQLLQLSKESRDYDNLPETNINEPLQAHGGGGEEEHISQRRGSSFSDASDTLKDSSRPVSPERTGNRGLEYERSGGDSWQRKDKEAVTVDEFGRLVRDGASESDSDQDQHPQNRKRRSYSRSRSRSINRSRSLSRSRSRSRSPGDVGWRSRSRSRSPGDVRWRRRSFSRSPRRRGRWSRSRSRSPRWRRSRSRTPPPRDLRWGGLGRGERDWRGDREFQERGRRGGGPNICFNYARGRCFRGNSCRFLHQDRKPFVHERDSWMQEVPTGRPEGEARMEDAEVVKEVSVAGIPEVETIQKTDIVSEVETFQKAEAVAELNANNEAHVLVLNTEMVAVVKSETPTQEDSQEKLEDSKELEVVERPDMRDVEVVDVEEPEAREAEAEVVEKQVLQQEGELFEKIKESTVVDVVEEPESSPEIIGTEKVEASKEMGSAKIEAMTDVNVEKLEAKAVTEWSLPEEIGAVSAAPPLQHEASRASIPALAPLPAVSLPSLMPFSQSRPIGQSFPVGNPSLVGQSYLPTSQPYPTGNFGTGIQQHNSLHHPLPPPPGNLPPYPQMIPLRQPINNTYPNTGNNFPSGNPNLVQPFPFGNQNLAQQPSLMSGNPGPHQPFPVVSTGPSQQAFLPTASMHLLPAFPQSYGPPVQPGYAASFPAQPGFVQNSIPTQQPNFPPQQPNFPPQNQPLNFPSNPPSLQQHGVPTSSGNVFAPVPHGFGSTSSLPAQQSVLPRPFAGDTSQQFTFPMNNGLQDVYSRPLLTLSASSVQTPMSWMQAGSLDSSAPSVSALPPTTRQSSLYSYPLTTIPPLSNLVKLSGVSNLSTSGDQYDPLSDSLDPGPIGGLKSMTPNFLKTAEEGKSLGVLSNTIATHLENLSPGLDGDKGNILIRKPDTLEAEVATINEAAGDPGVGIVENVSPPDRNWSPGQPGEGTETGQDQAQSKFKKSSRGLKLLRSAVAECVKELLKPTWREGHMSKEAFKTIAKKAVDKVIGTLPSHHIPKSQEKVDQFMASSRTKISKLVQGYVDKYLKV